MIEMMAIAIVRHYPCAWNLCRNNRNNDSPYLGKINKRQDTIGEDCQQKRGDRP
ncbi:MAG: hypothetical protein F6K09_33445 [Merismopedia sp. SIO2A8]|nr:hypothetical protein [Merismopedia sp. SIO2A8]